MLKAYEPNIECIEPQNPMIGLATCQKTLNKLSTSKDAEYFGDSDASAPDVRLPMRFFVGRY